MRIVGLECHVCVASVSTSGEAYGKHVRLLNMNGSLERWPFAMSLMF